jgi:large subunit ribosomal protein L11
MSAVKGFARLLLQAGGAKPSPAIGQALGPLGVNMMEFCKDFNAKTTLYKPSALMRVKLTAFEDRSYKYGVYAPPTSWYLKRVTGVAKCSSDPGSTSCGDVSIKAVYEIAQSKAKWDPTFAGVPLESICKTVIASARTCGFTIVK